ncbi:hypothetical protein B0J13DRAFT_636492 [Dactylonectria estremocensis]|uniref:Uncharacterized protein n=1 Tax=Dactylonectria estremocensis TaxID=1079267 RepID=A0A9P9ES10_9HYPO|nr:hypothetical protein B0J13DRAFT_636492 [Dactylonectria estremocensis]
MSYVGYGGSNIRASTASAIMGFSRNLERSINQFFDFQPADYRREIEGLDEDELRGVHKQIQRKIVGATTQSGLGFFAAIPSGGLSLIGTGIAARRIDVNAQRYKIIEARLREKGWCGHTLGFKDLACGAGPASIAAVLAPGADHLADQAAHHIASMASHHGAEQAGIMVGSTNPVTTEAVDKAVYAATHTASERAGAALGTAALHKSAESMIRGATYFALNSSGNSIRNPVKARASPSCTGDDAASPIYPTTIYAAFGRIGFWFALIFSLLAALSFPSVRYAFRVMIWDDI